MKRRILVLLLLSGMVGVTLHDSFAQAPKKDAKAGTAVGNVIVAAGKDGKYRFQVRTAEDKYVCGSGAYATEKDAVAAVEDLKKILATAKITVDKADPKAK